MADEKKKKSRKPARAAAPKEVDPKESPAAKEREAPSSGRLSRLRFKKRDIPGGLWLKCPSCAATIYRKELETRSHVCPSCSFHFTVPGRERIEMVLDEQSFEEHFAELESLDRLEFVDTVTYAEKIARTAQKTGQNEALLCGTGRILARPVVLGVLDFQFLGGSMGEVVGEKISLAADLARARREPLVLFTSSGGARMHEGMFSLLQMAKTCSALARLNDAGGFSICVLTNPTTGGVTASFASVCDLTLAEPGALIGFAGPRVIASTIKQELPQGFQRAEFLLEKGQLDAIVARPQLRETLARLIDYGTASWPSYPRPEASRAGGAEEEGATAPAPGAPAPAPAPEVPEEAGEAKTPAKGGRAPRSNVARAAGAVEVPPDVPIKRRG